MINLALIAWSKHFVTGIDSIDVQHKELVELVNAVAPQLAVTGEAPARDVRPLLDHLAQYTASHFDDEERLMRAGGIDPKYLAHHRHLHAAFAKEITQMVRDASADHNVSGANLLRFF